MLSRLPIVVAAIVIATSALLAASSCDEPPPGPGPTSTGAGGNDAGCPLAPEPMFTITITASDGPVPPDISLEVTWSAGTEPLFELAEPETWKTLEQGTNVVCDINTDQPPPIDLSELVCRLWTSGPTKVVIKAEGYTELTETLVPAMSDQCEGPIPKEAALELVPEPEMDAGP